MIKVDGAISEEGKTDEQGGEEAVATASTGSTMDARSTEYSAYSAFQNETSIAMHLLLTHHPILI